MRPILFFFFLLTGSILTAQSQIYSANVLPDVLNLNMETISPGEFQFAGDYDTGGFRQGFLSRHNNGSVSWSVDLTINGLETILSDQVALPDGNTALTGIYFSSAGIWEPYIMLVDNSGKVLYTRSYIGFNRMFVATHKIIFDPVNENLLICGANRNDDPRNQAFSSDQVGFVLAVDYPNLQPIWYQELENGQSANGVDYDLVESIQVLNDESILITGSMSDPANPHQRLMIGQLEAVTGNGFFVHQYDLGFGSTEECGADILQIVMDDFENTYVLVNATRGLEVICFDLAGQFISARYRIFEMADRALTGYAFQYPGGVNPFYVGGYIRQGHPNTQLVPFSVELESQPNCAVFLGGTHLEFPGINNSFPASNGEYGAVVGFDFLNTPDMFIRTENDHILGGYRLNAVDVNVFDLAFLCLTGCAVQLPVELVFAGDLFPSLITNLGPGMVTAVPVSGFETPRVELLQDECLLEIPDCDKLNCTPTVTRNCPANYSISIDGCIHPCFLPSYSWDIPGLCVSGETGSTISVSSFGGSYSYDVTATFWVNGVWETCHLSGVIQIPNFNCNEISLTPQLTHLGCNDYLFEVIPSEPLCTNATYDLTLNRNESPPICPVVTNSNQPQVYFDASVCGDGWYFYYADVVFSDNCGNTLSCNYLGGSKVYVTEYPPLATPNASCQINIGSGNPFDICNGNDYAETTVLSPLGSQYQYYWGPGSGTLGGTTYICCNFNDPDCWNPKLRVVDTNSGCEYVLDGVCAPRRPVQNPQVVLENRTMQSEVNSLESVVFPNPASDMLEVQLSGTGEVDARLFNLQGRELMHHLLPAPGGVLDIRQVPAGVYLLNLIDRNTGLRQTHRIIKQ